MCSLRGVGLDSVWSRGSLENTEVVWSSGHGMMLKKGRGVGWGWKNPVRSNWGMCVLRLIYRDCLVVTFSVVLVYFS